MINKSTILIVSILFFASTLWAGEINSVISEANQLKIQLTDKPNYKIIPQDDPFKLKIELIDTKPGILSKKILFHEGIVSEVSAQTSNKGIILEVLFSEPAKVQLTSQGNFLLVSFVSDIKGETKPAKIIDISMEKTDDGYEISIRGDSTLPEPEVTKEGDVLNLAFSEVSIATEPSKNVPVNLKKQGDDLVLIFPFGKDAETDVLYLGDEVILDVKVPVKKQEIRVAKNDMTPTPNSKKPTTKAEKIEITPLKQIGAEKTISLDLQDADIVGALRLLADTGGYNLVIHPRVAGKITLNLKNVKITQAMDLICKNSNLVKLQEDNIIRVLPIESYMIELVLEKKETRVYKLKYVRPSNILQRTADLRTALADSKIFQFFGVENIQIEKDQKTGAIEYKITSIPEKKETEKTIKYTVGTETREETTTKIIGISTDELTGSLIINAPVSIHKEIEKVLAKLDVPQKQILLEARILEVSSSFSKSLGFEWGIRWSPPDSRMTIVGSQSGITPVPGGSMPIAVNLPASTGRVADVSSAITVGYINATGTFALNLRISALQQTGKGKVLSSPRIITLDNMKASIIQGESIPYGERTVTGGATEISTKFKDVALTLDVTPRIIDEKNMNLYIYFTKEDLVEFVNIGGILAPRTIKLSGATETTVKPGETLVLGGIYKKTERMSNSKVPGLGDIPVVGELFTSRGRDEDIYEVLIFITPRIIETEY